MEVQETLAFFSAIVKIFSIGAWLTANVLVGRRTNHRLLGKKQFGMIGTQNTRNRIANKIRLLR